MLYFGERLNIAEKVQLAVVVFLQATLIIAAGIAGASAQWTVFFASLLAFLVTFLPAILNRSYRVQLPAEFILVLTVFVYAAIFLGEAHGFYTRFWWWDLVLHGGSGLAVGFAGFLILYSLYAGRRLNTSPFIISVFSFAFALAVGALWEIFEFTMDTLFGLNMQKTGLVDTMSDIIVDGIGAFVAAAIGYIYLKTRTGVFDYLVRKFLEKNPRFARWR